MGKESNDIQTIIGSGPSGSLGVDTIGSGFEVAVPTNSMDSGSGTGFAKVSFLLI